MRRIVVINGVAATCGALVLGGALRVAAQTPSSPAAKVDRQAFSNTWTLNADASETLRDKMRQARGGEHGGGPGGGRGGGGGYGGGYGGGGRGGYGGGRRGGGGGGGRGGDPGSAGSPDGMRETMRQLDEPPETLTIKQEEGAFLVGDDTGHIRRLYPDGRTMKADNGEGQVKTRWHGDELVTETIPAHGPQLKETFALSPDGRRLFVTTHFEPRWGSAVDVRRVYDAAGTP